MSSIVNMTEYKKKCKVCGKEFFSKSPRSEYCSEECRNSKVYISEHNGEKWGELTIISAFRKNRRIYAECQCSCGKMCTVRYDCLTSGNTRSCGHLSEKTKFLGYDLSGKINKYGIKAIKAADKRIDTSVIWECECVCGKIFEVPAYYFDKIKSCGCEKSNQCKDNGKKNIKTVQKNYYVDGTSAVHIASNTIFSTNKSVIRGVSWDKNREKWVAQIVFKGKKYNLGRYNKKEEAASARKEAEKYLYGDFLKWYEENYKNQWEKIQKKKNNPGE